MTSLHVILLFSFQFTTNKGATPNHWRILPHRCWKLPLLRTVHMASIIANENNLAVFIKYSFIFNQKNILTILYAFYLFFSGSWKYIVPSVFTTWWSPVPFIPTSGVSSTSYTSFYYLLIGSVVSTTCCLNWKVL